MTSATGLSQGPQTGDGGSGVSGGAGGGGRMDRLGAWLDDRVNPIILKELRQNAQSNVLASIIVLVMLVSLFIVGIGASTGGENAGLWTFISLNTFMAVVCAVIIPLASAARMLGEVNDTHGDLLSISTITPMRYVMGKIGVTLLIAAMVFGMSLPFLTVCYYLNGISIPLILIAFLLDAMVITGCVVFSICIVGKDPNPVTRYLPVMAQPATVIPVIVMTVMLSSLGGRVIPDMGLFGLGIAHFLAAELVLAVLFITAALVRMMPETANRSVIARLAVTGVTLGSAAYLVVMDKVVYPLMGTGRGGSLDGEDLLKAWTACVWVLMFLSLLVVIAGRDKYGARVRNVIPVGGAKRLGAFFLYSGAGGGVLWWLALSAVLLCVGMAWSISHGEWNYLGGVSITRGDDGWRVTMRLALYVFLFAMSAVLLRHYFLRSWAKPVVASVFAVAGMILSLLAPVMMGLFLMGQPQRGMLREFVDFLWVFSPLGLVLEDVPGTVALVVVSGWLAVVIVAMVPWLRFHWASFTRLEPDEATLEALRRSGARK
jgi:hypothetical protein